jgi:hypothetical protein
MSRGIRISDSPAVAAALRRQHPEFFSGKAKLRTQSPNLGPLSPKTGHDSGTATRNAPRSKSKTHENHPGTTGIPDTAPSQRPVSLDRKEATEGGGEKRPLFRFVLCRVQLLDADAKYASVKDLLDCCVEAGLAAGDREDQIRLEVTQTSAGHYSEEKTTIEIEYP